MGELQVGEGLLLSDGDHAIVVSLDFEQASPGTHFDTYNFEVEDWHTYFVASEDVTDYSVAVWVHNASLSMGCGGKNGDVSTGKGRDHVAYVGMKDGKPYSGYASAPKGMFSDPSDIVDYRYGGNFKDFGGVQPAVVDGSFGHDVEGKWKARGTEQANFQTFVDEHGIDGVANRQNPVGPNNRKRNDYMDAAGVRYQHKTRN